MSKLSITFHTKFLFSCSLSLSSHLSPASFISFFFFFFWSFSQVSMTPFCMHNADLSSFLLDSTSQTDDLYRAHHKVSLILSSPLVKAFFILPPSSIFLCLLYFSPLLFFTLISTALQLARHSYYYAGC